MPTLIQQVESQWKNPCPWWSVGARRSFNVPAQPMSFCEYPYVIFVPWEYHAQLKCTRTYRELAIEAVVVLKEYFFKMFAPCQTRLL